MSTLDTQLKLSPAPLCNRCGSKLIRISKKVKKIKGERFPITITVFKCSNKDCQKAIDKDTRERKKKEKERLAKKQPRI